MAALSRIQGMTGRLPTIGAVLSGVGAVATFAFMPADSLEAMVWNSGVAAVLPVAEPPLGTTARAVLALGGGAIAAAIVWSALYLLFGPGGFLAKPKVVADADSVIIGRAPSIRRADAHPDAPPRRPMSAADLGTPMMEVTASKADRTIPIDLDTPLAAIDPAAIPAAPREPLRPVAPLARPVAPEAVLVADTASEAARWPKPVLVAPAEPSSASLRPGERIETFELTPIVRHAAPATPPPPPPSIEALLRRLEEGAVRRVANG